LAGPVSVADDPLPRGLTLSLGKLTNREIAELLALESERSEGRKQRALRRASRSALMWPDEAAAVQESDRSLTELRSVGPFTASFILRWLRDPPDPPAPPPLRDGFITYAHARRVVATHPEWRPALRADHQMHTREVASSSNLRAFEFARAHDLPGGVGSDSHRRIEIGRTYVDVVPFVTPQELLVALREGKVTGTLSGIGIHVRTWIDIGRKFMRIRVARLRGSAR
jgi:hypothetical protein